VIQHKNTNITALQGKTQNITADRTATSTSKPLIIKFLEEGLKMNGNIVNIKAYSIGGTGNRCFFGNDVTGRLTLTNYDNDDIYIYSN
jgi:hypothetical protein